MLHGVGHGDGVRAAGFFEALRKSLDHELHAHMHIVVLRPGKALTEGLVEGAALGRGHIGQPVGHCQHLAHACIAQGRRGAQCIAVEGVETPFIACLARSLDEQHQIIAPVAGDHGLGTALLDLDRIGRKVLDAAHGVQLVAHDAHIGPLHAKLAPCFAQHGLAKAVVLPDQIGTVYGLVVLDDLHQRSHAHIGMGIEAEMPEAAALVGQRRVHGRIVQIQHTARRVSAVVLVDGVEKRRRCGRRVALHDDARTAVYGRAQRRQRLFVLPLAVIALYHQFMRTVGQAHAAARVHPLGRPQQIAEHGLARVCKRARKTLHQCQLDGLRKLGLGCSHSSASNAERRA